MQDSDRQWLTLDLLKAAEEHFKDKEIEAARLNAEILLAHVLQSTRMELYLKHDRPIFQRELEEFRLLCRKRLKGRPLQYITGEQIFYGHSFLVDERVLIPRPETELVLEHALDRMEVQGFTDRGGVSVLDIGTGTGCLAIMLALKLPNVKITAVDLSPGALEVAERNAVRHDVSGRIDFLQADALSPRFADDVREKYDVILSNPPYIPELEWGGLEPEVKEHEPKMALVTLDGFAFYRAITANAPVLLKTGGLLCFELHADGAGKVLEIVSAHGIRDVEVRQDYAGWDRVLSGLLKGSGAG